MTAKARLGDLVTVRGGGTPRKSVSAYYGGDVPWVTPKDMKRWLIASSEVTLTSDGVANSPAKLVPQGSALVVVRSGVLKHTLPVALTTAPVTLNQDMKALTPKVGLDSTYLARMIKAAQPTVLGWVRATTADNFPIESLLDLEIALPPIEEQRRIAAILDQADAIRTKRRRVLAHLDALADSTFHAMFREFSPNGTTFGELAEVQGGLQVTTKRASLPMTAPYLRVANVHRGRLELTEIKTLKLTESEFRRTALQPLDLLFVEGHANPLEIGRVALWDGSIEGCTHQNHLIRGRLDTSRCDPVFAEHWLNSTPGAAHLRRAGKTTSGLNTISASTVKTAPMLTPPLALQREFATRVSAINARRTVVKHALAADDQLFASLQYRAFRGEL